MTEISSRPTGVTVVAILNFVFGGLVALYGLILAGIGAAMLAQGWSAVGALGAFGVFLVLIFGIVLIVTGYGLWTGKSWGWWLEVVASVIGVIGIFRGDIVGAVISAIILWYFFKPEVKDYFGVKVDFST